MTNSSTRRIWFSKQYIILTIILLPILGYGVTHYVTETLSLTGDEMLTLVLLYAAMIAILLTIPYLMLKLLFHQAHLENPDEVELKMKDIPKDQDQLEHDHPT